VVHDVVKPNVSRFVAKQIKRVFNINGVLIYPILKGTESRYVITLASIHNRRFASERKMIDRFIHKAEERLLEI
jgi:hypothetical protein